MDIATLARRQHGVVARRQLVGGTDPLMTRHGIAWRLESGRWQRLLPGVYLTHTGAVTWQVRATAALLHAGPGAALGLRAAAYQHGFLAKPPAVIDVLVPAGRRVRKVPGARFTRRRRLDVVTDGGLSLTSVAETVLDLADLPLSDPVEAAAWAADAARDTEVTAQDIEAALARRRAHRQRLPLRLAFGIVAEGAESVLEVGFVERVLRPHGLPPMSCQVPAGLSGGSIRRDFVDEVTATVVECDGRVGHDGAGQGVDRRRDRRTAATGGITLRAGWVEVMYEPCDLAADLHGTLVARGRPVPIVACGPGCRAIRSGAA